MSRHWVSGIVLFTALVWLAADFAGGQDPARKARKAVRDYSKAVRTLPDQAARAEGPGKKSGTPGTPPGKGWRQEEFRVEGLRPGDLGVAFEHDGESLVVHEVAEQGIASRLGFRVGDRVMAIDGHRVGSDDDFLQFLFAEDVRWGRVGITLEREGNEKEIYASPSRLLEELNPPRKDPLARIGLVLGDRSGNNLHVADIMPQSPAETARFQRRDEIVGFNGEEVRSVNHLRKLLAAADDGVYVVEVSRGQTVKQLKLEVTQGSGTFDRKIAPAR